MRTAVTCLALMEQLPLLLEQLPADEQAPGCRRVCLGGHPGAPTETYVLSVIDSRRPSRDNQYLRIMRMVAPIGAQDLHPTAGVLLGRGSIRRRYSNATFLTDGAFQPTRAHLGDLSFGSFLSKGKG